MASNMDEISLRLLLPEDEEFLLNLRNSPAVRKGFFSSEPVSPGNHRLWFREYLEDTRSYCFIAQVKKAAGGLEPIGYCRFDHIGDSSFGVSIAVEPRYQSSGRGLKVLRSSLTKLRAIVNSPVTVRAEILKENAASRSLFHKAGFVETGDFTSGRLLLDMEL